MPDSDNGKVTLAVLAEKIDNLADDVNFIKTKLNGIPVDIERIKGNFRALCIVLIVAGAGGGGYAGITKLLGG